MCGRSDLNCGPEASAGNYRYMLERGYEDAVAPFAEAVGPTWDPTSTLNNLKVFADCPAQRIDHLFLRGGGRFALEAVEKVFTEPIVTVGSGRGQKRVHLSDHYGLVMTLVPVKT